MTLQVKNISKRFSSFRPLYRQLLLPTGKAKDIKALDSVSFTIEPGQILGVAGANGAGKTTLLRIIADVLEKDSGSIFYLTGLCGGCENLSRRGIGYVSSDERSFFWRLSGRDNLLFFARLYGLTSKHGRARIEVLLKQFDFEKRADDLFKNYSAGMRKKVSIIRALMHQPSLLLLDEVTNSLDPESTAAVKKVIRQYVSAGQGRMAIWSTHRLEEMPEICDGFLIIDSGRIVSQGAIADFKSGFKGEKYFASCC